jgi:hypothetical protein
MGNPLLTSEKKQPASPAKVRNVRDKIVTAFEKAGENGEYTDDELQAIHAHFDEFTPELHQLAHRFARRKLTPVFDLAGALALLGQTSVVTPDQHVATFKRPLSKDEPVLCPSMEQIQECADQNKAGTHKWILTYASALSFREQHSILGTDGNRKPNYYPGVDWFLKPKEKEWADGKPEVGYYLLDMSPRWNLTNWQGQGDNITALGEDYERADERVFSQAVLAHQKATSQRLFDNDVYHWGRILDSNGCRVCVELYSDGLFVNSARPSYGDRDLLCVCVARKSQLRALIA